MPPKHVLYRNIVMSLAFLLSIVIITISIATWGSAIGFSKISVAYNLFLAVMISLAYLFALILFGSISEVLGHEPDLLVVVVSLLVPLGLTYAIGVSFEASQQIAGILIGLLVVTLYVLFSSSE
ncbi:MAG: hypothetical protein ACTSVA_09420 [Candidatus Njordarchaeales archaeon]